MEKCSCVNLGPIPFLWVLLATLCTFPALGETDANPDQYNRVLKSTSIEIEGDTALLVREISFLPGWKAPTHFHNADLFIYVMEGDFEVTMEHTGRVVYSQGEALEMRAKTVMDARNVSDVNPLVLVVFQVGAPDSPFVVPVE